MFEASEDAENQINPDSLKPHAQLDPAGYTSEFKSQSPKSADYHDSPEYRKSLHLQGAEREAVLQQLRARLGMTGRAGQVSQDVLAHQGVETGRVQPTYTVPPYSAPPTLPPYSAPPTVLPYSAPPTVPPYSAPPTQLPYQPLATTTEQQKYEAEPRYEAPKYMEEDPEEELDSFKHTLI